MLKWIEVKNTKKQLAGLQYHRGVLMVNIFNIITSEDFVIGSEQVPGNKHDFKYEIDDCLYMKLFDVISNCQKQK